MQYLRLCKKNLNLHLKTEPVTVGVAATRYITYIPLHLLLFSRDRLGFYAEISRICIEQCTDNIKKGDANCSLCFLLTRDISAAAFRLHSWTIRSSLAGGSGFAGSCLRTGLLYVQLVTGLQYQLCKVENL